MKTLRDITKMYEEDICKMNKVTVFDQSSIDRIKRSVAFAKDTIEFISSQTNLDFTNDLDFSMFWEQRNEASALMINQMESLFILHKGGPPLLGNEGAIYDFMGSYNSFLNLRKSESKKTPSGKKEIVPMSVFSDFAKSHQNLIKLHSEYHTQIAAESKDPELTGSTDLFLKFIDCSILMIKSLKGLNSLTEETLNESSKELLGVYKNGGEKIQGFIEDIEQYLEFLKISFEATQALQFALSNISAAMLLIEEEQERKEFEKVMQAKTKACKEPIIEVANQIQETSNTEKSRPTEEELKLLHLESLMTLKGINLEKINQDIQDIESLRDRGLLSSEARLNIAQRLCCALFVAKKEIKSIDQIDGITSLALALLKPKSKRSQPKFDQDQELIANIILADLQSARCRIIHNELANTQYDLVKINDAHQITPSSITAQQIEKRKELLDLYKEEIGKLEVAVKRINDNLSKISHPENSQSIHWSLGEYKEAQGCFEKTITYCQNQDELRLQDHDTFKERAKTGAMPSSKKPPTEQNRALSEANKALSKQKIINYVPFLEIASNVKVALGQVNKHLETSSISTDSVTLTSTSSDAEYLLDSPTPVVSHVRSKSTGQLIKSQPTPKEEFIIIANSLDKLATFSNGSFYSIKQVGDTSFIQMADTLKEIKINEDGTSGFVVTRKIRSNSSCSI